MYYKTVAMFFALEMKLSVLRVIDRNSPVLDLKDIIRIYKYSTHRNLQ